MENIAGSADDSSRRSQSTHAVLSPRAQPMRMSAAMMSLAPGRVISASLAVRRGREARTVTAQTVALGLRFVRRQDDSEGAAAQEAKAAVSQWHYWTPRVAMNVTPSAGTPIAQLCAPSAPIGPSRSAVWRGRRDREESSEEPGYLGFSLARRTSGRSA